MPDEALFAEAEHGTLRKNLAAQVKRMLADPKASALVENFGGQWLQIRNLKLVQPDAKTFPEWDQALATAMSARFYYTEQEPVAPDAGLFAAPSNVYISAPSNYRRHGELRTC